MILIEPTMNPGLMLCLDGDLEQWKSGTCE